MSVNTILHFQNESWHNTSGHDSKEGGLSSVLQVRILVSSGWYYILTSSPRTVCGEADVLIYRDACCRLEEMETPRWRSGHSRARRMMLG